MPKAVAEEMSALRSSRQKAAVDERRASVAAGSGSGSETRADTGGCRPQANVGPCLVPTLLMTVRHKDHTSRSQVRFRAGDDKCRQAIQEGSLTVCPCKISPPQVGLIARDDAGCDRARNVASQQQLHEREGHGRHVVGDRHVRHALLLKQTWQSATDPTVLDTVAERL